MKKKYYIIIALLIFFIVAGLIGFIFWEDVELMLGFKKQNRIIPPSNFQGKSMFLTIGETKVELPNEFPKEVINGLKKNLNEKAGMPIQLDKTGNGLPFGIP